MLFILRSNQPIAWLVIPASIAALAALTYGVTGQDPYALVLPAVSALILSAIAHRIYLKNGVPAIPDSAFSWLVAVTIVSVNGAWSWSMLASVVSALAALDSAMGVYQQQQASREGFRAGAWAGLAASLHPVGAGALVGMLLVFGLRRPFKLREWAMLLVGAAWPMLLISAACPFIQADSPWIRWLEATRDWSPHWGVLETTVVVFSAAGAVMLSSANQKANMKSRAARLKLSAFFATMGAIGWFLNETALLSLGAAPLILWIVPLERGHSSRARRTNSLRWTAVIVFVGILWALGMAGG